MLGKRLITIVLSTVLLGLAATTAGAHGRVAEPVPGKARGVTATVAHQRVAALAARDYSAAHIRGGHPPRGWVGSRLLNPRTDDWEPAVAADPHAPYVYMLTTRFGAGKTCPGRCPTPYIALTVSSDGGRTWGPQRPLCVCQGASTQYDPTIEVVPGTGAVYAAFLNGTANNPFSTAFVKSTDHGATWSAPVKVYGNVAWTDKPEVTMSRLGPRTFRVVERPHQRRPLRRRVTRLRRHLDAAPADREPALLLRLRRPRARRTEPCVRPEQPQATRRTAA